MKEPTGDGPFPDSWALEPGDLTGGAMPDWPQVPAGYAFFKLGPAMVTLDGIHWREVPDDVPLSEFLAAISQPAPGSG